VKPLDRIDLDHILLHTKSIWSAARGRRIFISGGTGFFGAWLLESLAHCNRELDLNLSATVLSRDPAAFLSKMPHLGAEPSIRFLRGDVRSFGFPGEDHDYFIHGAAPTSAVAPGQQFELMSTLLDGARRVLAFAQTTGARRFLFVSSGAVYGPQPENLSHIPEGYLGGPDWLDPASTYAEGKRVCEQLCSLTALVSAIEFRIARCFAFAGPHLPLDQHFAIGNFIRDALAGRNIAIRGDGTPLRSYLYAADLAVWLWTLLFRECDSRAPSIAVNVGSSEAISIRDLAQTVIEELDPALAIGLGQKPIEGRLPQRYVPDVRAAESRFGLRQFIGLRESIRRTANWHR